MTAEAASAGREAGELRFPRGGNRPGVRYAYEGRARLLESNAAAARPVPDGWRVLVAGLEPGRGEIELGPGESRTLPVTIAVPAGAAAGVVPINVAAIPDVGEPGGITVRVVVEA